jgi:hypothetical protein
MQRGIEVRTLPRLHAKVLLCDWRTVTIGSQNFTGYARRSREATAAPANDLSASEFTATLREWLDASVPVDLAYVERLLAGLDSEMEAVRDAQAALTASYEQLREAYERQRQLEEIRRRREQAAALAPIGVRLGAAVRDVRERLARPAIWAQLKEVSGSNYTYYTLRANTDSNLTQWPDQPPGQAVTYRSLARLNMYPVILSPSGRMGFWRVGRGQISYVRSAVDMQAPESFAGMRYRLNVECPGEDFETANLHITLTPDTAQLTAVKLPCAFPPAHAFCPRQLQV